MNIYTALKAAGVLAMVNSISAINVKTPKTAEERYNELLNNPVEKIDYSDMFNSDCGAFSKKFDVKSDSTYINLLTRAEKAAELGLCVNPKDRSKNSYDACFDNEKVVKTNECQKLITTLATPPARTTETLGFFDHKPSVLGKMGCIQNFNKDTVNVIQESAACRASLK